MKKAAFWVIIEQKYKSYKSYYAWHVKNKPALTSES